MSMAIKQGRKTHTLWVISTKWAFVLGDESLLHMLSQYILQCEMKQISRQEGCYIHFGGQCKKQSSHMVCCALCLVTQSCLTVCNNMGCARQSMWSPLDTPLSMGILQARILGWVAMPSSRESFQPRNWTQVSCIVGRWFTNWAMREAHLTFNSTK